MRSCHCRQKIPKFDMTYFQQFYTKLFTEIKQCMLTKEDLPQTESLVHTWTQRKGFTRLNINARGIYLTIFMISDYSFLTIFRAKERLLKTFEDIKTNKVQLLPWSLEVSTRSILPMARLRTADLVFSVTLLPSPPLMFGYTSMKWRRGHKFSPVVSSFKLTSLPF